jgi:hypothetical protein
MPVQTVYPTAVILPGDLDNATVELEVAESWLREAGVSEHALRIFGWVNGEWRELKTEIHSSEDGETLRLSASSSGASIFVVGAVEPDESASAPIEMAVVGMAVGGGAAGAFIFVHRYARKRAKNAWHPERIEIPLQNDAETAGSDARVGSGKRRAPR